MELSLKTYEAWEVNKQNSHNSGAVGKEFGAFQFSPGKNCSAEIRGRCKAKNLPCDNIAAIFRDDRTSFKHLTDVQSVSSQGLIQHLDVMRKFAVRHFSNPDNLPYLMALLETSLEPFGKQKVGKFPKNIISEEHRDIIRSVPPTFAPFLADELRHIYNASLQAMGDTLEHNGIDLWQLKSTVRDAPMTALGRPPQLIKAISEATGAIAHKHFVASSRSKGVEAGTLRYVTDESFVSNRDVRSMVEALHTGGRVPHSAVTGRAMAFITQSFASQFGGFRNAVPLEVARVHAPLHDVLRPFFSPKYEADIYANMPGGRLPTLKEALKSGKKGAKTTPSGAAPTTPGTPRHTTTRNPHAATSHGVRRGGSFVPANPSTGPSHFDEEASAMGGEPSYEPDEEELSMLREQEEAEMRDHHPEPEHDSDKKKHAKPIESLGGRSHAGAESASDGITSDLSGDAGGIF